MSEERARILQMISEGKISAEEGAKLLNTLHTSPPPPPPPPTGPRWFHIRVTNLATGRITVDVTLPFNLMNAAIKLGARFPSGTQDLDWNELSTAIHEGASGKLVEFEDSEGSEKVEVIVE